MRSILFIVPLVESATEGMNGAEYFFDNVSNNAQYEFDKKEVKFTYTSIDNENNIYTYTLALSIENWCKN